MWKALVRHPNYDPFLSELTVLLTFIGCAIAFLALAVIVGGVVFLAFVVNPLLGIVIGYLGAVVLVLGSLSLRRELHLDHMLGSHPASTPPLQD